MNHLKVLLCLFLASTVFAGVESGKLMGRIIDRNNLQPLAGANMVIQDTTLGSSTDQTGIFRLGNLKPGSYNLSFFYLGYKTVLKSNVIINPSSQTYLEIEMEPDILESDAIEVTASYFESPKEAPVSRRSMDFEEIRRSPGAMLDVQKVVQALPAVIS